MGRFLPFLCFGVLGFIFFSGCQARQSVSPESSAIPESPGHMFFLHHCVACHTGSGNPPGPNMVVLNSKYLASEEDFAAFLRKPASPMMPAFSESALPEADIQEIYDYLKTKTTETP